MKIPKVHIIGWRTIRGSILPNEEEKEKEEE
jgi:hypothetical protein